MELNNPDLISAYREWSNQNGGVFANNDALLAGRELAKVIFRNWILENGNTLPAGITHIETHPYLAENPINFESEKLIIGTFPPISYLADQLDVENLINPGGNIIKAPTVSFFHGNRVSLWRICSDTQLQLAINNFDQGAIDRNVLKEEIHRFLGRNSIGITDLVIQGQRALINADDTNIWNLELNIDLVIFLCCRGHNTRTLIFTNSVNASGIKLYKGGNNAGQINIRKRDAFSLFLRACQLAGISVEIASLDEENWASVNLANINWLNANTNCKLIFRCKLISAVNGRNGEREFIVITPPSPSGGARRGLANNANRLHYSAYNPGATVEQFRRAVWHNAVVTNNHQQISLWQ